jgi:hypothetical protein
MKKWLLAAVVRINRKKKGCGLFYNINFCSLERATKDLVTFLVHHTMFLFVTTLILSSTVSAQSVCVGERLVKTE